MLPRTKVGLVMVLMAMIFLFAIFLIYTFAHGVFLYYLLIYGEEEAIFSPYIALGSFAAFFLLLHLAWLVIIVGFILILTDALKYQNLARSIVALILWFLLLPGFYGMIYLFFQIGFNPLERGVYMVILVMVFIWIVVPMFIPLMSMHGKRRIKWPMILLPFCAVASIVLSFLHFNKETMFAMLPIALFFNLAMFNLIRGYLGVYNWIKCIPKGATRKEMLAHKFIYFHEEGQAAPDQIICQSDTDFITFTVKPVAKESNLGRRSLRISVMALVVTVFFSLNCLVLKQEGPIIELFRRVTIPVLGTLAIGLILASLAYSGYTVHNIKEGRFKEDKKARYAMTLAVGTAVLFLALSMSIGIYLA
jgi:hypothetical protein